MDNLIKGIEDRLFTTQDSVCLERARLVTEAYRLHEDKPAPTRRALAFEHILENMTLDLASNPVFAGNTSSALRAWMLVPEFDLCEDRQISFEHPCIRGILSGQIPEDITSFWKSRKFGNTPGGSAGIGHMSLDFDIAVNQGLNSVIRNLESHVGSSPDEEQTFRRAMLTSCRAVISWADRYARTAGEMAKHTKDPMIAECLERISKACLRVPGEPARNLFEGLQSIVLIHLASIIEGQGMSVSIGLPDRVLSRFSQECIDDPSATCNLVRAFLLKLAANSFHGRGSKTQAITIGGAQEGRDCCNPVSYAFLDAFARSPVNDPHLFLRWHPKLDEKCWKKGIDMLAQGRSMPMLVNDEQVVPGLVEAGVSTGDAWEYCIVGCNELGIPGKCCQSGFSVQMGFNDLEVIDRITRSSDMSGASDADILDAYEKSTAEMTRDSLSKRMKWTDDYVEKVPFPFCSSCCIGTVESGQDLLKGMKYPHIYGLFIRGTSNAVNALSSISNIVEKRKLCSLNELISAIDSQDPRFLAEIAKAPKWGNDDEAADGLCIELNLRRDRALRQVSKEAGLPRFAVCHVVRSLHHIDGQRIGNTVDGRKSGSPVADSVGAVLGTQTKGPTALLNSVSKINASRSFPGIYNLNMTLPSSPDNPVLIRHLLETFFRKGGQEIQVNVIDAVKLREAQKHPELFRDLIVRIAGFNARFIELAKTEQEELIRRAENATST